MLDLAKILTMLTLTISLKIVIYIYLGNKIVRK